MSIGEVSGDISVDGGERAYGMITGNNLLIDGDMSGSISVAAQGNKGVGIYSGHSTRINGDLSGSISASAGSGARVSESDAFLLDGKCPARLSQGQLAYTPSAF